LRTKRFKFPPPPPTNFINAYVKDNKSFNLTIS
jgi:hypothetical protein